MAGSSLQNAHPLLSHLPPSHLLLSLAQVTPAAFTCCRHTCCFHLLQSHLLLSLAAITHAAFREKLDKWLTARGKTPTRYRHSCCFHVAAGDVSCKTVTATSSSTSRVDSGLSHLDLAAQVRVYGVLSLLNNV